MDDYILNLRNPFSPLWIFVHGFAAKKEFWKPTLKYFTDQNFLAIDLPAHGNNKIKYKNEDILEFLSFHTFTLLNKWIEKLQPKNVILVGHSLGAYLVAKYELTFSDISCTNILVGAPNNLKRNIKHIMTFKLVHNFIKDLKALPQEKQAEKINKFINSKSFLQAYKGLESLSKKNKTLLEAKVTIDNMLSLDFELLSAMLEMLPTLDIMPILKNKNYKKRTLFLVGSKDKYVNLKRIYTLSTEKNWLFIKEVKNAPHFLPKYYPKKFADILQYWMDTHNKNTSRNK